MSRLSRCPGMYVGVGLLDWRSASDVRKLLHCISHNGRPVSADEFRLQAAEAKAKGYEVFPQEGCTNVGPDGYCAGHSDEAAPGGNDANE